MKKITAGFILIYVAILVDSDDNSMQCKNEDGEPVDWFVLYKLPVMPKHENPLIKGGFAYLYITSETVDHGWTLAKEDLKSANSIPAKTLSGLYNNTTAEKNAWIVYGYQPPNRRRETSTGHANGVLVANEDRGLWLIHSVPSFPPMPRIGIEMRNRKVLTDEETASLARKHNESIPVGEYHYPEKGKRYGQSFLCISVNASQINAISNQLIYNEVFAYKYNLPEDLKGNFSVFENVVKIPGVETPPFNSQMGFESIKGEKFISFARTKDYQKDLYATFVARQLKVNMFVQTYCLGHGSKSRSVYDGMQVLDVKVVGFDFINVNFNSTKDHSKWAIADTKNESESWVCIGDFNRVVTQVKRGGGTVCLNSLGLWKSFRNAVIQHEKSIMDNLIDDFGSLGL